MRLVYFHRAHWMLLLPGSQNKYKNTESTRLKARPDCRDAQYLNTLMCVTR